jgi:hypothetical protein
MTAVRSGFRQLDERLITKAPFFTKPDAVGRSLVGGSNGPALLFSSPVGYEPGGARDGAITRMPSGERAAYRNDQSFQGYCFRDLAAIAGDSRYVRHSATSARQRRRCYRLNHMRSVGCCAGGSLWRQRRIRYRCQDRVDAIRGLRLWEEERAVRISFPIQRTVSVCHNSQLVIPDTTRSGPSRV